MGVVPPELCHGIHGIHGTSGHLGRRGFTPQGVYLEGANPAEHLKSSAHSKPATGGGFHQAYDGAELSMMLSRPELSNTETLTKSCRMR